MIVAHTILEHDPPFDLKDIIYELERLGKTYTKCLQVK
jgi:hypothetical protein